MIKILKKKVIVLPGKQGQPKTVKLGIQTVRLVFKKLSGYGYEWSG